MHVVVHYYEKRYSTAQLSTSFAKNKQETSQNFQTNPTRNCRESQPKLFWFSVVQECVVWGWEGAWHGLAVSNLGVGKCTNGQVSSVCVRPCPTYSIKEVA